MNTSKMIRTLEQLCDRMINYQARLSIRRDGMFTAEGDYEWWCNFNYENKYGGSVDYSCSNVSLDRALAGLIDKLDAVGLLGDG